MNALHYMVTASYALDIDHVFSKDRVVSKCICDANDDLHHNYKYSNIISVEDNLQWVKDKASLSMDERLFHPLTD